jgi:hypothetical protein
MFVSEGSGSVTNRRSETFRPRGFWDHRHAVFNGLDRRGDSDQTLKGLNLISEATLNVLEPGGGREIIAVEEKRSHVCHEHMSFKQEVVRLCQLGIGE